MFDLYRLGLPLLTRLEPEQAHRLTIQALKMGIGPRAKADAPLLQTDICGLRLANPIGLAAGFDKNGEVPHAMLRAGFGFVEVGTITPRPQAGNPKPRIFRLRADRGVINRLGFNNEGADASFARLKDLKRGVGPLGINIGANRDSDDRIADYVSGYERFAPLADYITVNVSSPNTPGLRDLQLGAALSELLAALAAARGRFEGVRPPLFLKVAPDLSLGEQETVVETAIGHGVDGLIVGNTTISRPAGLRGKAVDEAGGLSGAPLLGLSTQVLGNMYALSQGRLALIGAGGISSGEDAYRKILAGASAVQLYTALVYEGPGLIARIKNDLAECLRRDGHACVADAVGAASA